MNFFFQNSRIWSTYVEFYGTYCWNNHVLRTIIFQWKLITVTNLFLFLSLLPNAQFVFLCCVIFLLPLELEWKEKQLWPCQWNSICGLKSVNFLCLFCNHWTILFLPWYIFTKEFLLIWFPIFMLKEDYLCKNESTWHLPFIIQNWNFSAWEESFLQPAQGMTLWSWLANCLLTAEDHIFGWCSASCITVQKMWENMIDYKLTWRFLGHYDPQKAMIVKAKKEDEQWRG